MNLKSYDRFFKKALPRLEFQYEGFKRVRRQVYKRIGKRITILGLRNLESYEAFLAANPEEWQILDSFCRITISRFSRDANVFDSLLKNVLPILARGAEQRQNIHVWSAGCASGEEPYSIAMLWDRHFKKQFPSQNINILATDTAPHMLNRAKNGHYERGSFKELNPSMVAQYFTKAGNHYEIHPKIKQYVTFEQQDIRENTPNGPFEIILCRNLVFTYFNQSLRTKIGARLLHNLTQEGFLVLGRGEKVPDEMEKKLSPTENPCILQLYRGQVPKI